MSKIFSFIIVCVFLLNSCNSYSSKYNPKPQSNDPDFKYKSYKGLVMAGYQGWFAADGDESNRGWYHYGFKNDTVASFDFWPDMTEYTKKYVTPFKMADGSDSYLFSAYDEESVDLHFRWMKEYGIDGVFMIRFVSETKNEVNKKHFNKVLENALNAARKYERAISIMYDLSGCKSEDMNVLEEDWKELMYIFDLANREKNPTYLWHNDSPLLSIWGVGFNDGRRYSLDDTRQLVIRLKKDHKISIMLGVPYFWRTLCIDTQNDPMLHEMIKENVDIIMPWAVGRYDHYKYDSMTSGLADDFKWCRENNVDYVPLVFPGFSWANLFRKPEIYDQIPRMRGDFLWKQVAGAKEAGANALFVAMFDEIDEGTAIFKCAEEGKVPVFGEVRSERRFVGIEEGLGSDYYLWLIGQAANWIHGASGYSQTKPQRIK